MKNKIISLFYFYLIGFHCFSQSKKYFKHLESNPFLETVGVFPINADRSDTEPCYEFVYDHQGKVTAIHPKMIKEEHIYFFYFRGFYDRIKSFANFQNQGNFEVLKKTVVRNDLEGDLAQRFFIKNGEVAKVQHLSHLLFPEIFSFYGNDGQVNESRISESAYSYASFVKVKPNRYRFQEFGYNGEALEQFYTEFVWDAKNQIQDIYNYKINGEIDWMESDGLSFCGTRTYLNQFRPTKTILLSAENKMYVHDHYVFTYDLNGFLKSSTRVDVGEKNSSWTSQVKDRTVDFPVRTEFTNDAFGHQLEERFYSKNNELTIDYSKGYAKMISVYDENYELVAKEYYLTETKRGKLNPETQELEEFAGEYFEFLEDFYQKEIPIVYYTRDAENNLIRKNGAVKSYWQKAGEIYYPLKLDENNQVIWFNEDEKLIDFDISCRLPKFNSSFNLSQRFIHNAILSEQNEMKMYTFFSERDRSIFRIVFDKNGKIVHEEVRGINPVLTDSEGNLLFDGASKITYKLEDFTENISFYQYSYFENLNLSKSICEEFNLDLAEINFIDSQGQHKLRNAHLLITGESTRIVRNTLDYDGNIYLEEEFSIQNPEKINMRRTLLSEFEQKQVVFPGWNEELNNLIAYPKEWVRAEVKETKSNVLQFQFFDNKDLQIKRGKALIWEYQEFNDNSSKSKQLRLLNKKGNPQLITKNATRIRFQKWEDAFWYSTHIECIPFLDYSAVSASDEKFQNSSFNLNNTELSSISYFLEEDKLGLDFKIGTKESHMNVQINGTDKAIVRCFYMLVNTNKGIFPIALKAFNSEGQLVLEQ